MIKIVLVGGHLSPALATVERLAQRKEIEVVFFGRKHPVEGAKSLSAEFKLINDLNIKFYTINAGRLQRKFTRYTIPSILKIPFGFLQSLIFLIIERPKLVISFGGYLSTPVVFAAWLMGIDSVSHEQSIIPGLSTRINSIFAQKVFLTWQQSQRYFSKDQKFTLIGNLIRPSLFKKDHQSTKITDFINRSTKLIYITGGNLGSHFLNQLIFRLIEGLAGFQILHQIGTVNKKDLDYALQVKKSSYLAVDYLTSEAQGAVLTCSEVVIARSGANTIWDLALLAKCAILVPLPISASGEQEANAQILKNAGSAIVVNQDQLTPEVMMSKIAHISKNLSQYQKAAYAFQKTLPKDGLEKFSAYLFKVLQEN